MVGKYVRTNLCWLILGGICAQISCTSINNPFATNSATNAPTSVPTEVKQNVNTVTVEIFIIPIASHKNELLQQLWREVDEQSLSPQLRRELLAQGFRVGILGNLISPALTQLLKVSGDTKAETPWGDAHEFSVADATHEPAIIRNLRSLLPGMRTLVKIFDDNALLPELFLLRQENGMMCGQTYKDVLGLVCVSAVVNKDGSTQIQIVPELEHGFLEQRIRPLSGVMVVQERSRPRYSFESLTITQRLLPGQWLIMGMTTLDSAGVGKAFFSRQDDVPVQRLLAIRFVHATPVSPIQSSAPMPVPKGIESMPERN